MYLCETELLEKELLFCLKIDLALNNLSREMNEPLYPL